MSFTTEDYGTRIERKYCAHYTNVNLTTPKWERLGKDLEEFNIEMNAQSEDRRNILGENETIVSGYAPSVSVNPYYARQGTDLFDFLQEAVDDRKILDDLKIEVLEVHVWDHTTGENPTYTAYKETAIVVPVSKGGDTTGYQIPFELHLQGDPVKGQFAPGTKTFTPAS